MDVKEAITQLTGLKKYCEGMAECDESGSYVFDLDVQALDMAITALSPAERAANHRAAAGDGRTTVLACWVTGRKSSATLEYP